MRRAHAERSRRRSWSSAQWCAGRTVLPNAKAAPCGTCALQTHMGRGEKYPVKRSKEGEAGGRRRFLPHVRWLPSRPEAGEQRTSRGALGLPNVEGKLDAAQALSFAEKAGCEPAELLKSVERVHVFTHIIWRMRCYYIVCRKKARNLSGRTRNGEKRMWRCRQRSGCLVEE